MKRLRYTVFITIISIMLTALSGCEYLSFGGYGDPIAFSGTPHDAKALFVNCGKADSAIVLIDDCAWLIDTGTEESAGSVYSALAALEITELDGIVISHSHDDHVGGLDAVLQKYPTKGLYSGAVALDNSPVKKAALNYGIQHTLVKAGDSIAITEDVGFAVIAPTELNEKDDNDNSLVLSLSVNGRVFLFTGDMQKSEEELLIKSNFDIAADVLKVGNHGNSDATSKDFAIAVSPHIAVISTDTQVDADSANKKVIERLGNAEIYITQDYEIGVLVSASRRGELTVSFPTRRSAAETAVEIASVSKASQTVILQNNGGDTDISGWYIYSTRGHEYFAFPENASIAAGESLVIACKGASAAESADFVWNDSSVWSKNKDDTAILYDRYGNEIARYASS